MADTGKPALAQGTRPLRTSSGRTATVRRPPRRDASKWLFVLSGVLLVFCGGVFVGHYKTPPYETLRSAKRTIQAWKGMWDSRRLSAKLRERTLAGANADEPPIRFVSASTLTDPVLLQGGLGMFTEYCPAGCIAVKFGRAGQVEQAWPFYPEGFDNAAAWVVDWPYEYPIGSRFADYARIESVSTYPNGDLLVGFYLIFSHPNGGGVARVAPSGRVIWYRRDYSHHPVFLTKEGVALVSSSRYVADPDELPEAFYSQAHCRVHAVDYLHVIDGSGQSKKEISVLDALNASPWQGASWPTIDPCDRLHLNFVHEVGETGEVASSDTTANVEPGDFVLSLHNISAFAIMDRQSHRLKRMVHGSFAGQHSVTHVEGAKYVMFDNFGGYDSGESRIVMVDLATGAETTIFPTEATPKRYRGLHSIVKGYISVSSDRKRVIATYSEGRLAPCPYSIALELRISDGEVLSTFCTAIMASYADP